MATPFLTKANARQLEAVEITGGPLLIIARPRSGKTFTLDRDRLAQPRALAPSSAA